MKLQKWITIITIILLVIIITAASFVGIYQQKDYKVSNVVPNYKLGMEFTNSRITDLVVDTSIKTTNIYDNEGNLVEKKEEGIDYTEENGYKTEEIKTNPDSVLTKENYKMCKEILIDRLNELNKLDPLYNLNVGQYIVKQNDESGSIQIEIPEDKNTDNIIDVLIQSGEFELKDADTDEVLLDNSYIEDVKVGYGQNASGVSAYLQIKFNQEGQARLEEISKTYIETTEQVTDENGETKDESKTKTVKVFFDGEQYKNATYFGETITDGTLAILVGSSTDSETLKGYSIEANSKMVALKMGIMPVNYEMSSYIVSPIISTDTINLVMYIAIGILSFMLIYLIAKFKLKGIFAVILQVGYVALLLLVIRYANVQITIDGMFGIALSVILNYIYIYLAFKNKESNFVTEITAKYALELIPIYIIAAVFTFNTIANISSLGMTLVWGIIIMYIYNLILTQITVKTIDK